MPGPVGNVAVEVEQERGPVAVERAEEALLADADLRERGAVERDRGLLPAVGRWLGRIEAVGAELVEPGATLRAEGIPVCLREVDDHLQDAAAFEDRRDLGGLVGAGIGGGIGCAASRAICSVGTSIGTNLAGAINAGIRAALTGARAARSVTRAGGGAVAVAPCGDRREEEERNERQQKAGTGQLHTGLQQGTVA